MENLKVKIKLISGDKLPEYKPVYAIHLADVREEKF